MKVIESKKNYYGKILAKYYDAIVNSGYYDYDKDIKNMKSIIGDRKTILELGIGTANFAIKLAKSGFKIDGIEPSKAMIDIARKKIKKEKVKIDLYQQDVKDLDINKKYQIVLSHGGVPVYIRAKTGLEFESYLLTLEENKKMLKKVYDILEKNGLFLISIHKEHTDLGEFLFGDNLKYFPKIKFKGKFIEKTHCIYKRNKPIAQQTFYQRRFKKNIIDKVIRNIGFKILGENSGFYVFIKK